MCIRDSNKRERAEEPAIPPVDSDMISVRETARRLGICRQTIYNLAAKGIITIYHVTGRLSYVSWSEACATISTRTAPAIQQKPRRSTRKKHPEQPAETSSKAAVPAPPTAANWAAAQELCARYNWDTAYLYRFVQCHRISRIKDGRYSLYSIPQIEEMCIRDRSYIKRLKEMEDIAMAYPGVMKTYAIQAGRELRVIVGSEKISDQEADALSHDIAKKIQDEMTYPGQVKITVIRETRSVSYAK